MKTLPIACTLIVIAALAGAQTPVPAPAAPPQPPPAPKGPLVALPYTPSLHVPSMDLSADPCVDFYQYTCGGWMKQNPIPSDESTWSVYGKLYEENQRFLWGILDEASRPGEGRDAVTRQVGDYFAACMDEPAIDKAGAKPIEPILREIAAIASLDDLARVVGRRHPELHTSGMLFGFGANQDFGDSSRIIAFAGAGGLGLPDRDYYFKDDAKSKETRERYVAHVGRMLALAGDAPQAAADGARAIMTLETALAGASLTNVERRDPAKQHHLLKRAELQALTPDFSWDLYFEAGGLPRYEEMNVTQPKFYEELGRQLRTAGLVTWKAYLRWHLVRAEADYLGSAFQKESFDFNLRYLRGVEEMPARWKQCVELVDRDLGEALGQVFVRKTFTRETKARVTAMAVEIQKAMEEDIKALPWMGPETRKRALEKLHTMANKIGYPDRWRDYSSVTVARNDFFGNVARAAVFETRRQMGKIGKPIDRGEWQMTPPTVNAYYDAQMNDMNFPAGVLQPPLYDPKMDDAPNFGNTGATIAHELTHGFDDEGRHFDARGNLTDWWTKEDAAEFERRAKCISDQFSQYVAVDDVKLNGQLSLGEDVADLGGQILAFMAWKNATKGLELKPVDGFTPEQRFFIGMGQWACSNITPEEARLRAQTDPHSPPRYRINGVVANMPQFRQAFGCKPGQPMVREPVCRVW